MNVVALDLSLTATGVADAAGTRSIRPRTDGVARLVEIRDEVMMAAGVVSAFGDVLVDRLEVLVAIEGYSFGSPNRATALGELGGVVKTALWEASILYAVVPPAAIKKYACGKGNAAKPEVYGEAIRRLDYGGSSHDEADAMWLRALVCDALGKAVVKMPAKNGVAVASVKALLAGVVEKEA